MTERDEIKELTEFFGDQLSWDAQKYDHEISGDGIILNFYEGNEFEIVLLVVVFLKYDKKKRHIIHVYKRQEILLNLIKERLCT